VTPLHGGRTREFQVQYHLGRNDAPEFDQGQPGRIDLARFLIEKILLKDLRRRPLRIVELGCGAGDVSGPYAGDGAYAFPRGLLSTAGIEVVGIDVVPIAKEKCNARWPEMNFILADVQDVEPMDCDILVMTEFLEHLADPMAVAAAWMPHAKWAVIGHPLNEPDPPYEHGHSWSYTEEDWRNWFALTPMPIWEMFKFPMGYYPEMIMGHGGTPE
jgi:SAM-dependent methyltransferase